MVLPSALAFPEVSMCTHMSWQATASAYTHNGKRLTAVYMAYTAMDPKRKPVAHTTKTHTLRVGQQRNQFRVYGVGFRVEGIGTRL